MAGLRQQLFSLQGPADYSQRDRLPWCSGTPTASGKFELPLDQNELENIRIAGKGPQTEANFVLVRVVGCLTPAPSTTASIPKPARAGRVEAHGLLYRDSGNNWLNFTSLETVGADCRN